MHTPDSDAAAQVTSFSWQSDHADAQGRDIVLAPQSGVEPEFDDDAGTVHSTTIFHGGLTSGKDGELVQVCPPVRRKTVVILVRQTGSPPPVPEAPAVGPGEQLLDAVVVPGETEIDADGEPVFCLVGEFLYRVDAGEPEGGR